MKNYLLLTALALAASGCATITRGTTTAFVVETEPSGAQVKTSLGHSCDATPCTFAKVPREAEFVVTIAKEGYETSTHNITHATAPGGGMGMAGNLLLGGVIGAAVDGNNGATQNLVPNPLRVTLSPAKPALAADAAAAAAPPDEASPSATAASAPTTP